MHFTAPIPPVQLAEYVSLVFTYFVLSTALCFVIPSPML